jgi:hypothetical protein
MALVELAGAPISHLRVTAAAFAGLPGAVCLHPGSVATALAGLAQATRLTRRDCMIPEGGLVCKRFELGIYALGKGRVTDFDGLILRILCR